MNSAGRLLIIALMALTASSSAALAGEADRLQAERYFIEAQKSLAEGDDVRAEQQLMNALKEDPGFTSAIWQLSQIYEKRGRLEYARELIIRGLDQQPDASWARDRLAQIERTLARKLLDQADSYMDSGRYDLAVPKLSQYMGLKPHDTRPLEMLGRCHLAMGNLDTAREYLSQALQRDPSDRTIASLLDEVERRVDMASVEAVVAGAKKVLADYRPEERDKAREALRKVLEVDPANAWAEEKLAELDLLEQKEEAAAILEESRKQAQQVIDKGVEAVRNIEAPSGRVVTVLRSSLTIALLAAACVLLAFILKRRSRVRSYPLQGSITVVPLLDVVSLLNANLKTGRLLVTSSRERGEIFFEKGEVVHARFGQLDGRKAFHSLIVSKSGQYVFSNRLPNIKHTITEPLSILLLSLKTNEESARPAARTQRREKAPV